MLKGGECDWTWVCRILERWLCGAWEGEGNGGRMEVV